MRDTPRRLGGLDVVLLLAALIVGLLAPLPGLTPTAYAQTCSDLLTDGGFEAGDAWLLGPSPVMPQYVTYAKHGGNRSLVLGITSGANIESFSSARQTVTLPAGATQITLSFWAYAMADSPATTDYMEVVLLNATGTAILNKPWQSHNDSRRWNPYSFDLTPWRGQTVQVYFNVYNDGVGGRAAMFLDDVSLQTCTGSVITGTPTNTPTATPIVTTSPTLTPTPTGTVPSGCTDLITNGGFDAGLAGWQQAGGGSSIVSAPEPVRTGPNALQLGSLTMNLVGEANVRQPIAIPVGYSQVTLEVWVYELTQDVTNADYQKIELLNSAGLPWVVLSYGTRNNAAWRPLTFNLTAYSGNTGFINFAVNNDGVAGRTAMYVDDVRLRACNPGPVTPSATPTATRTTTPAVVTATPTTTPGPVVTVPPGPGCIQLINNNGFETGVYPWLPGKNELPAKIVTPPDPGGAYAVGLGALADNANSYSSIRQWINIPASHPNVIVSFWAYTRAESLWGADRQQFVVLGPGDAVLTVPWKVLENEQVWQQHPFRVDGVAGQTIGIYFNVINDGAGGRTSMFLDEVYAWACTPGSEPTLTSATPPGRFGMGGTGVSAAALTVAPETSASRAAASEGASTVAMGVAAITLTPMQTVTVLEERPRAAEAAISPTNTSVVATVVAPTPTPRSDESLSRFVSGLRQRLPWLLPVVGLVLIGLLFVLLLRRTS